MKIDNFKKKIIALIPARGGSKGLPGKNIKMLAGKHLLGWSIIQALESKYVDKVVVSTDNKEIAKIAKKYGAEVPFLRPKELAKDNSPTMDAIFHALNLLEKKGEHFDLILLLEPTSPLRETKDIDKCFEILVNNTKAKAIVSISKLESAHPEFNVSLNKDGFIRKWHGGGSNFKLLRRQELSDVYFFEGSVYISDIKTLRTKKTFYHEKTLGYVVPRYKSLEIDDIYDFVSADAILKQKLKGKLY